MESYKPYCYLYKDIPNEGDLYVSTVVQLPIGEDLVRPIIDAIGSKTTVTYSLVVLKGLPAGIRMPSDEKIAWDGTEKRIVEVVVVDGNNDDNTTMNTDDLN